MKRVEKDKEKYVKKKQLKVTTFGGKESHESSRRSMNKHKKHEENYTKDKP